MKNFLLVLWAVLLLSVMQACVQNEEILSKYTIDCTVEADSVSLPQKIARITYLPLENAEGSLIYEPDKLLFGNDKIYMADYTGCKIVAYDREGAFLFAVDRRGPGPTEYLEIKSFTVDDRYIYILDNFRHKVFMFDCNNGEYRQAKDLPIVAWDMETLRGGDMLFAYLPLGGGINMKQSDHFLFVTDSNFHVKQSLAEYESGTRLAFAPRTILASCGDDVLFSSLSFDGFTVIPKSNPDSLYRVAMHLERAIPAEKRGSNKEIDRGRYHYLVNTPVKSKNYFSFEAVMGSGDAISLYVYDRDSKKLMTISGDNAYNLLYYPIGSYQDRFVSYISDYGLYQELVAAGFERADQATEEMLGREGSVLVFYEMK